MVQLRPLSTSDLATHAAGCDDLVNRWTNDGHSSTQQQNRAWLARNEQAWRDRADVVDLAVEDADTGEHVGVVGIQRRLDYLEEGEVNLTYTLYAGRRGRGYATAAALAAMELALSQAPVRRFLIRCDPDNTPSGAVARRLGFQYVGAVVEPDGWRGDRYVCEVADGHLQQGRETVLHEGSESTRGNLG